MSASRIIEIGDPVLREKSKPVTVFHKNLRKKIDGIKETLYKHGGAAAVAAPQIALLKRITVIDYVGEYLELVNPEITESSGKTYEEEGCLSLPNLFGMVERAKTVTVKYQDRNGDEHTITRSDEMARCLQHEIDHMDGILFIDRMTEKHVTDISSGEKVAVKDLIKISNSETES